MKTAMREPPLWVLILLGAGLLGPLSPFQGASAVVENLFAPHGSPRADPAFAATGPQTAPPDESYDAVMILGQSNAVGVGELDEPEPPDPSVWMLGNDYLFKMAYEPVDDSLNQVDRASLDPAIVQGGTQGHSWILRAAKGIARSVGRPLMLIPCQKGGSRIETWFPGEDRFDRSTLYGSANTRRLLAAPHGLKAVWCFGHESSSEPPFDATYSADWKRLIEELRADNGEVPVIYAQLAGTTEQPGGYPGLAELLLITAEKQRQQESGFGNPNAVRRHFMVVSFDLPLVDYIHLNRLGVNTLADRFALAMREHVYRQRVNGTGPRLLYLIHPRGDKSKIQIRFNRCINQAFNNYDNQFRAYDQGLETPILHVQRDRDRRSVLITLTEPAKGPVEISYGGRPMANPGVGLPNVIKDADGLPAPQFRRLQVR